MQAGIPGWVVGLAAIGGFSGIAALVTGIGAWVKNHRDADLAETRDERAAKADSVEIIAKLSDQYDRLVTRLGEAQMRAARAEDESASARRDIDALLDRVAHLERVEDDMVRLAGFVVVVKAGVESGAIPPWPSEPPTVAALMSQIKREDSNGNT